MAMPLPSPKPLMAASVSPTTGPSSALPRNSVEFLPRWSVVTIAAAALATALDAVLLQRSKSFFTGGFLSGEHLHGAGEIALFLLVSLIADAAVIGVLAAVAMVMLARARVAARACTVA